MREALPKLWPAEQEAADPELRRMAICGEDEEPPEEVRLQPVPCTVC